MKLVKNEFILYRRKIICCLFYSRHGTKYFSVFFYYIIFNNLLSKEKMYEYKVQNENVNFLTGINKILL